VRSVAHALVFVMERKAFTPLMAEYPADMNQLLVSAALRYRSKPKAGYVVGAKICRLTAEEKQGSKSAAQGKSAGQGKSAAGNRQSTLQNLTQYIRPPRSPGQRRRSLRMSQELTDFFVKPVAVGRPPELALGADFQHGIKANILAEPGGGDGHKRADGNPNNRHRRSPSKATGVEATKSNPLAFVATAQETDPEVLMHSRRLQSIKPSSADDLSALRDEAIVEKLMEQVSKAPSRASIDFGAEQLDQLGAMDQDESIVEPSIKERSMSRKSVHQQALWELTSQLNAEESERSSALSNSRDSRTNSRASSRELPDSRANSKELPAEMMHLGSPQLATQAPTQASTQGSTEAPTQVPTESITGSHNFSREWSKKVAFGWLDA